MQGIDVGFRPSGAAMSTDPARRGGVIRPVGSLMPEQNSPGRKLRDRLRVNWGVGETLRSLRAIGIQARELGDEREKSCRR
jgi:hypothetical protein